MAQSILDSLVSPLIIHRALLLWFAAVAVVARCIDPFTMNTNSEASIEDGSSNINEYARLAEHSSVDNASALTCKNYYLDSFLEPNGEAPNLLRGWRLGVCLLV